MVNKVILVGNVGKDPEVTYTQSGKARAKFSVATNRKWKSSDGTKQEKTAWHNIVVWEALAKICGEYLRKGRQVYVEGEIEYREYEKDGTKRYMTEINASNVIFMNDGSRREGGPARDGRQAQTENSPTTSSAGDAVEGWDDGDIPF